MASTLEPFFKRIVWLTLFLGILIGMWLILAGVKVVEFFSVLSALSSISSLSATPLPPPLIAPMVERLLGPFQSILLGAILVLEWKVIDLRLQRRAFLQSMGRADARSPLLLLALGICSIISGCWALANQAAILPASAVIDWVLIGGMCICVGVGFFADLSFVFRVIQNKRRAFQQG